MSLFLKFFGGICLLVGIGPMLFAMMDRASSGAVMLAYFPITASCVVAGVLFFAYAEMLDRLRSIDGHLAIMAKGSSPEAVPPEQPSPSEPRRPVYVGRQQRF